MAQELLLIRGLPGAGKTTIALEYVGKGYSHFEADMFFDRDGKYCFDASLIGQAHDWCASEVRKALADGKSVVVANTFSRLWEMQKYFEVAEFYGADLRVIEAKGDFQNIHGVPQEVIEKMRNRWEKYEPV